MACLARLFAWLWPLQNSLLLRIAHFPQLMLEGEWKKASALLEAMPSWDLLPNPAKTRQFIQMQARALASPRPSFRAVGGKSGTGQGHFGDASGMFLGHRVADDERT
eukprot:6175622-Pleurochrysis_carterae.AAC.1